MFGPQVFSSFDTVISYLAQQCITIGRLVTYIHDRWWTLTFRFKSTWIWVWTWSCSLTYAYQIWHKDVLPWGNLKLHYITSEWPWPLNSRLIFVNMLVAGVSFASFTHSFCLVEQVCTTSKEIWDDKYIQSNNQLFYNWKISKNKILVVFY